MDRDHVNTVALAAGNGAMLAFVIQNFFDGHITESDATRVVLVVVIGLAAAFGALFFQQSTKARQNLIGALQGLAAGGIVGPPALWLARMWGLI